MTLLGHPDPSPFVLPGTRQDRACKGHPAEVLGEVETLEHGQKNGTFKKRTLQWKGLNLYNRGLGPQNSHFWSFLRGQDS